MKKILSLIVLIAICSAAFAQPKAGIIAGVNFAKTSFSGGGFDMKTSTLTSFHVGLIADVPLASSIYFQPQLLLSGKGGKIDEDGDNFTVNPFYLELPLNFVYKGDVGSGQLFGGVGPYIGVGLFGKEKGGGESMDIKFGSGDDADYKRTDFGGNIIAGYQFNNGFLIAVNYSLGLSNVANSDGGDDGSAKNSYFGVSLGYLLGGSGGNGN